MAVCTKLPKRHWGPKAAGILELLQGRCAKVHVTGGWLRDRLLETQELNPKARVSWQRMQRLTCNSMGDIDLVVSETSTEDLFDSLRSDPAFRSLLRKTPLLVPQRGKRAQTVKLIFPEASVDITSLADRWKQSDSTGEEELLREDSHHRDTTFNSMYLEVETEKVFDPSGGVSDLSRGLVRSPHPLGAAASLQEDPVRLLRLLRFAARYDFRLDTAVVEAAEEPKVHQALVDLFNGFRGRVLFEVKKALLLHNQPWRFLELCGECQVEDLLFGPLGAPRVWPGAIRSARRLGQLLLFGLDSGQIQAKSERFRGRHESKGMPVPLLMPDWRKLGVWENDWLELLLAAVCWSLEPPAVRQLMQHLQLSKPMGENVLELLHRSKQPVIAAHTQPPGVHLLHAAACSAEAFEDFWRRWPVAPGDV